jgi:hypothetical protein
MNAIAKRTASRYDAIELEYGDLADGTTLSGQLCPACEGGSSRERTMSVTAKEGMILFHCHRATCPFSGVVLSNGARRANGELPKERRYPLIKGQPVEQSLIRLLSAKYGVKDFVLEYASLRWTGEGDGPYSKRVAFPIFDPDGNERGVSYRSYIQGVQPKAIVELKSADAIKACWYKMMRKSDSLVIVEDQMSALKLAPHTHTVALLGTHVSQQLVDEIVNGNYDRVRISLDQDAVYEAVKLQLRMRHRVPGILVASIQKDIKDFTAEEVKQYVQEHL